MPLCAHLSGKFHFRAKIEALVNEKRGRLPPSEQLGAKAKVAPKNVAVAAKRDGCTQGK